MNSGKRWTVRDRLGNEIYLTDERWKHIIDPMNHPEMIGFEEHLKDTIRLGRRQQDSLNPQKYRYIKAFNDLVKANTHIVAIVIFRFNLENDDKFVHNNYILTAYQKKIGL
ncbi:hypothetical protein L0Z72_08065 [candidate division KSB1 bacterium]|nr:hypothetical protein [candidate division KSB1 bacterium]